ncbi:MAG: hypothetical protein B7Z55_12165 [Planctomycetales bacterium 12-60-4]|nr:MAG: hypothetical protein B7Z55_12165 [Planctomycetales bacterium 12-60-4]
MSDSLVRTPGDFLARLEEGDRWIELVRGRLVRLSPPDELHGNVVRNLSKALSTHFRKQPSLYACYELSLLVSPAAVTIRTPAISCFPMSAGLVELDKLLSETVPDLVVEIASSNDRIWVFDPESLHVHVFAPHETPRMLKETEMLTSQKLLPGFGILVGDVFMDPQWARKS